MTALHFPFLVCRALQVVPKLTHQIEMWKPATEATNLRRIDENKQSANSKKAALPSGIQYNGGAASAAAVASAPPRAHEWLSPWFESLRDELQPVCELVRLRGHSISP